MSDPVPVPLTWIEGGRAVEVTPEEYFRRFRERAGLPVPAADGGPPAPPRPPGPGTSLKRWLGWAGIRATPGCGCADLAARMDDWGPDGTLAHLDEVVAALRAEAARRGLPFSAAVARALVRRAVRAARRKP